MFFFTKWNLLLFGISAYFTESSHNLNLIGINWETASKTLNYYSASKNVNQVGTYTAELIDYLVKEKLMNLENLALVGFSLGAHVAGIGIESILLTNNFVFIATVQ